jgi:catechol 2,3-dioxygenase-like lactoylglutathione lyase family enzyme
MCEDEEATREFYTEIMGFDLERILVLPDGRRALFFNDGTYGKLYFWSLEEDSDHSLRSKEQAPFGIKAQRGDAERPYEFVTGIHHVSWGVETEEELMEMKSVLEESDVPVWGPVNRSDFAYDLYFEDPNGNNLEIHTPGPNSDQKGVYETSVEASDEAGVEVIKQSDGMITEGSEDGFAKRFASSYWR